MRSAIRRGDQRSTSPFSGTLEILVFDNGDGVAAGEVPRLFLRRASVASAEDRPRHGLGLHLASELAAGFGGKLTYSPAQPVGSRFRLTLPSGLAGEVNVQEAMPASGETET
jgi:signal transduction histidine kinase